MTTITRRNRLGFCAALTVLVLNFAGASLAGVIGAAGDVYVSDGDVGGVFQYDGVTGGSVGLFASRPPRTFMGQAWGPDGNLYAVSNANMNRWDVDKYDGNTGVRLATVVPHLNDGSASVGKGIAFGPDGDLYVGDWFRARIDRYDGTTFAPKAGYQAVPGDNLGTPNYMTFAPNGHLMVVSGGYNKVLEFDTSGNGVNLLGAFASLPNAQQPQDLKFGPNGNLFVTGGYAGGVMEFNGTNGAFIGNFVPPDPNDNTLGLVFDRHGRMLVATAYNTYRVAAYDALTAAPLGDFIPYGSGGISSPIYLSIKPVPEPTSLALLAFGALMLTRRR